jgi:hypothetical protein
MKVDTSKLELDFKDENHWDSVKLDAMFFTATEETLLLIGDES